MTSYQMIRVVQILIYTVPATLIAIVLHEVAHALMSYACGDDTVKREGRLSLNPFRHLDLMGTLCLLVFHMGWAKPVRVNTRNYKHKRLDFCLVALAGPVMNFLIGFLSLIFMFFVRKYNFNTTFGQYLFYFFYYTAVTNVGLGVFNLIPIPPLDGSNVLFSFLPYQVENRIRSYRRYFPIILAILLLSGILNRPLSVVNTNMINGMWNIVVKIFGYTTKTMNSINYM